MHLHTGQFPLLRQLLNYHIAVYFWTLVKILCLNAQVSLLILKWIAFSPYTIRTPILIFRLVAQRSSMRACQAQFGKVFKKSLTFLCQQVFRNRGASCYFLLSGIWAVV